jgi:23S rRNA (pseudouridine1915-N3)-methyltransferase
MFLTILSVCQKQPLWAQEACEDYRKRFKRPFSLDFIEVGLAKRSPGASSAQFKAQWLEQEANLLKAHFGPQDLVVALDVAGKELSSEAFANTLGTWQGHAPKVYFLIGGPDGLEPGCLARAQLRLSLSKMTLPHSLAKVFLVEQLYRAWSLLNNHPYHRA